MDYRNIIEELCLRVAISGFEKEFSEYLKALFKPYCTKVNIDTFFNVLGFKKGSGEDPRKILITAHYDEIGLIITDIDKNGFLKFSNIGGVDSKILLAQEVIVHGKEDLFGVIGSRPPHLMNEDEKNKAPEFKDMCIDVGLSEAEVKAFVDIGDVVSFVSPPVFLKNERLASKSLDNRSGVAVLLGIAEALSGSVLSDDVYFAATVQEEVGLRGAVTAAYNINPDIAIVIDVCHGKIPDVARERAQNLGEGPAVGIGPNLNKEYTQEVIELARMKNIPYQLDVEPGNTGTEAWAIQISRQGVPTILISVPLRYMHTTVETVSLIDIELAVELVLSWLKSRKLKRETHRGHFFGDTSQQE